MAHVISFLKAPLIDTSSPRIDEQATTAERGLARGASVPVDPRTLTAVLFAIMGVLIIASLGVAVADTFAGYGSRVIDKMSKAMSVDREMNVPAFFSMLLLLSASLLLGIIASIKVRQNTKYRWHWTILAMGFLYMAFDEIGEVHEKLIEPMRAMLGGSDLGVFYFAWVVPAIVVVSFLAFVFFRFWSNLVPRTRLLFFLAGALFLGGAVGVELLNGKYAEIYGKDQLAYQAMATVEEALEMTGVIVFIYALLDYIRTNYGKLEFHLADNSTAVGRP